MEQEKTEAKPREETSEKPLGVLDEEEVSEEDQGSHIYVIKVTTNKEDRALEMISDKVKKKELNVYSLTRPHGLKGYIFLEAKDRETAEEAAYNLPYVKGIIGKTVTYDEIKNMLTPSIEELKIEEGDIIEMIGEPFKKEKAKVTRVDKQKGEVVVSLLGAVVPIPVTVKIDNVKVIRREEDEEDISGQGEEEAPENKPEIDPGIGPKIGGL